MRLPMNTYQGEGTSREKQFQLNVIPSLVWYFFWNDNFLFCIFSEFFGTTFGKATSSHLQSNYFCTRVTFLEQLFLQSSCFFEELCFFEEINLRKKKKWLISCSYNPKETSLLNHFVALSKSLDLFTTKYERLLFLGDFNGGSESSSYETELHKTTLHFELLTWKFFQKIFFRVTNWTL